MDYFRVAFLCVFFAASFFPGLTAHAKANPKYASIVIDAGTGQVLHESNADKKLHPASLAKVMTLLLAFEALEQGRLRLSDPIFISQHAASMVPSKLGIKPGGSIRAEDAIYALVTKSANDIAVAMAERLGGTESQFAVMMTRKAREIGMTSTTYRNASGLHNPAQVSSARDQAKLALHVLSAYPGYYHYFSTRNFSYRGASYHNHNRLMETYKGMDGFKTGYIGPSGFNLIASAKRGNTRLVGVVFGGVTANSRNAHMASLLDKAFAGKGTLVASAPLPPRKPGTHGTQGAIQVAALEEIGPAAGLNRTDPMMQGDAFTSLIGEGDYDPAVSKRLETGLMAIAALREDRKGQSPVATPVSLGGQDKPWSIQIGAFGSRAKTDQAIRRALDNLPPELSNASAVIVPLKTAEGWVFRGRLSGYDKDAAFKACGYLHDCLPVSPSAQ